MLVLLSILAALTAASGGALACVPQARLVTLQPQSFGPAGSELVVEGLAFDPAATEIRWGSPNGPLLATSMGPDFSAPVTVPDVPAGLYAIMVIVRQPGGGVGNAGRAAFQVTSSEPVDGIALPEPGGRSGPIDDLAGASSLSRPQVVALVVAGLTLLTTGVLSGALLARRCAPKKRRNGASIAKPDE